jgi:energy-coupling factor transporter ATP-binding protein EcfA2
VRRNLAVKELAWLRRGAPARTAKPKARIATATALVNTKAQAAAREGALDLTLGGKSPASQRLGSKGVELRGVSFTYPDGPKVLEGVNVQFEPGDRVGIVGPNGVGKSTLLDVVVGRLTPDAGEVEHGTTVKIGYYDQLGKGLDTSLRVRDLDTLRAFEDFLDDWPGIVVVVSHDRSFLDRVTDELLALDGRGGAAWIRGGVAGWLAQRSPVPSAAPVSAKPVSAKPVSAKPVAAQPIGKGRSPSTVRRQLGQAERDLAAATERRDAIAVELQSAVDHREMGAIGERLATAQAAVDALEETWLSLADEAEALGLEL